MDDGGDYYVAYYYENPPRREFKLDDGQTLYVSGQYFLGNWHFTLCPCCDEVGKIIYWMPLQEVP